MNILTLLEKLDSFHRIEQKSQEWLAARKNLITASEAGYFLGIRSPSGMITYIKNKLNLASYNDNIKTLPAIKHGNIYEDVSRVIYETRHSVCIREYGLITTPKTSFLGASPDGIVSNYKFKSENSLARLGRLIEIKNPYDYDASTDIKPEYLVQIYQQQYVLGLTECDFIKTNIIGSTVNENTKMKHGLKPYSNIDEFLADIPEYNQPEYNNLEYQVVNKNIPVKNHSRRGMEKGILIYYNDPETKEIITIIYPIIIPYEKNEIYQWIKTTKNDIAIKYGISLLNIAVEYWYVANYYETTIKYDPMIYEKLYVPRLNIMWKLVLKLREYQYKYSAEDILELLDGALLTHFKAFNTKSSRVNKYKLQEEHNNILQHMEIALLLTPVSNKLFSVKIDEKSIQPIQPIQLKKTRKSKKEKEIIEYDFE